MNICGPRFLVEVASALLLAVGASQIAAQEQEIDDRVPSSGNSDVRWLRPEKSDSPPQWGHRDGIRVGLPPLPGPRGLLRIYARYLGQREGQVINYLAVEPIPNDSYDRGLSELEYSKLDNTRGKRMWSAPNLADVNSRQPPPVSPGVTATIDGVECLRVLILVEPFDNGGHVYLRITFRADRPHEVGIATFAFDDSKPLAHCIVTATMGNFARLRQLQLADRVVAPDELWPGFSGTNFTPHATFGLADLMRTTNGEALAVARPNESHPEKADYAPGTRQHWHYDGASASQSWRCATPSSQLKVFVNGRRTYWNSDSPIPGGVAFENFEMVSPFQQGAEYWYGVEPILLQRELDAVH